MAEIGFYHLTRTGVEAALPRLLARTLSAGERALVLCADAARVQALDELLWRAPDADWLPHGTARMGYAELQPIWLTDVDENPNGARFLFLLDGARSARAGEHARVFDLFDGRDESSVTAARERWAEARIAGHTLTYWQQGENGWVKRA